MADGDSKEEAPETPNPLGLRPADGPVIVCVGCGSRDNIKKPFKHPDATGIFWCAKCGTLIQSIEEGKKLDGLIPHLTGHVLKAMTGYASSEELIAAETEKRKLEEERKAKAAATEAES